MNITLRDEILVVCPYESKRCGKDLLNDVKGLRKAARNTCLPTESEFREMLLRMVEVDNILEPWAVQRVKKKKLRLFVVGEFLGRDPLLFHYKLTPLGWRSQRSLLDIIRKMQDG